MSSKKRSPSLSASPSTSDAHGGHGKEVHTAFKDFNEELVKNRLKPLPKKYLDYIDDEFEPGRGGYKSYQEYAKRFIDVLPVTLIDFVYEENPKASPSQYIGLPIYKPLAKVLLRSIWKTYKGSLQKGSY